MTKPLAILHRLDENTPCHPAGAGTQWVGAPGRKEAAGLAGAAPAKGYMHLSDMFE